MTFQPSPAAFSGLLAELPRSPVFRVRIDNIDVSGRLRPVDAAHAQVIAASLSLLGQQQAVIVRRHASSDTAFKLVVGAHRLAGGRQNGWSEVDAIEVQCDDEQARLIEIDENLARVELSKLDRAIFLVERKRIYEALHPEAAHGKAKKPKKNKGGGKDANFASFEGFAKDVSKQVDLSVRAVQIATRIAEALAPEAVGLIRGSLLSRNQSQLQALAELPHEQQIAIAKVVAEKPFLSFSGARTFAGLVPKGGAVREADQLLSRLEALLGRQWSREQLKAAEAMIKTKLAAAEAAEKPARAKKGGAA